MRSLPTLPAHDMSAAPTLPTAATIPLAELFIAARRDHRRFSLDAAAGEPRTADDAYRVQDAVARALGWFDAARPSAWKTGAPDRAAVPIAAPLPAALLRMSPARFDAREFHTIGIEAEIALRFHSDVDAALAGAPGFDWAAVIGDMRVGIEVVDSRIDDAGSAPALLKLADFQQNGAYVIGTGVPYRGGVDWASQRARVLRNGAVIADTRGGHPLGDPTWLLPWFVRHVEARCGGVRAGDLVTLGTWAGLLPAACGERIHVEFDGVGQASVDFT